MSDKSSGSNLSAQTQIQRLLEVLKDPLIVELLTVIHRIMLPFFYYYCDLKKSSQAPLMRFSGFCKFCGDFGIFPDILSKPKLLRFFNTLASFYTNEESKE
jgi:hypothetical protein